MANKAARKGDATSGHGCFPGTAITSGSPNVLIDGIPASRVSDSVAKHACPCDKKPHGIHSRAIAAGSSGVFINGLPAARVGDAISCGGAITSGSGDVFIGEKVQVATKSVSTKQFVTVTDEETTGAEVNEPPVIETPVNETPVNKIPVKETEIVPPEEIEQIGIIPVRYALSDFPDDYEQNSQQLPPGNWKGPIGLNNRDYILRQLRDGWVNVYIEKNGDTPGKLDTYQVIGGKFSGAGCLIYNSTDQIFISFSHREWTPRIKALMSESIQLRTQYMRRLNLNYVQEARDRLMNKPNNYGDMTDFNTLQSQKYRGIYNLHTTSAAYIDDVADIGTVLKDKGIEPFSKTCTPLSDDSLNTDDSLYTDDGYDHIKVKAASPSEGFINALPQGQEKGIIVALDDSLADMTDLYLSSVYPYIEKTVLENKEENYDHKLKMAQITMSLGRVGLTDNEIKRLPSKYKNNPIKVLELERFLSDYVINFYQYEQAESVVSMSTMFEGEDLPMTSATQIILNMENKLKNVYQYQPTEAQMKKWKYITVFTEEVDWDSLYAFLISYAKDVLPLQTEIDKQLTLMLDGMRGFGHNILTFGLDDQDTNQLAYMLTIVNPMITNIQQATTDEKIINKTKTILDPGAGNNMLTLAPFAFSIETFKTINEHVEENTRRSLKQYNSEAVAIMSSISGMVELFTNEEVKAQPWFAQTRLSAITKFQEACNGAAIEAWKSIMKHLLPTYQTALGTPAKGMTNQIKYMLLLRMVSDDVVLKIDENLNTKLNKFYNTFNKLTDPVERYAFAQSHYPTLLELKNTSRNNIAKQYITDSLGNKINKVTKVSESIGGPVALMLIGVNFWNMSVLLHDVKNRAGATNKSFMEPGSPYYEVIYCGLSTASITMSLLNTGIINAVNENPKLVNKAIGTVLKESVKRVTLTEKQLIKTLAKRMAIINLFMLASTSMESVELFGQYNNSMYSTGEQIGYFFKLIGSGGMAITCGGQLLLSGLSLAGFLYPAIAAFLTGVGAVAGVVYVVGLIIYDIFHTTDLEKWLKGSTWGKANLHLSNDKELHALEQIINKPSITLTKAKVAKSQTKQQAARHGVQYNYHWIIKITPPIFTYGKLIALKINYQKTLSTLNLIKIEFPKNVKVKEGDWLKENNIISYNIELPNKSANVSTARVAIRIPSQYYNVEFLPLTFASDSADMGPQQVYKATETLTNMTYLIVGQNTKVIKQ